MKRAVNLLAQAEQAAMEGNPFQAYQLSLQATEAAPRYTPAWAWSVAAMLVAVAVVGLLLPQPLELPVYTQFQPIEVPPNRLFGLERVPIGERAYTPTPTAIPFATATAAPPVLPTLPPETPIPPPTLPPTLPAASPTSIPTLPPATSAATQPAPTQPPPNQPPPTEVPPTPTAGP